MRSLARPPALSTAPSLMLQSPIYEGAVASSMAACRRARASRPLSLSLAIFALKLLASIIGDASAFPLSSPVSSMGHAKLFCDIGPSSLLPSPQKVSDPPAYRCKVLRQCGRWQCPLTIDADAPCGRANLLNTGHVCTFICDPIPISAAPGIATWRETRRRTALHHTACIARA